MEEKSSESPLRRLKAKETGLANPDDSLVQGEIDSEGKFVLMFTTSEKANSKPLPAAVVAGGKFERLQVLADDEERAKVEETTAQRMGGCDSADDSCIMLAVETTTTPPIVAQLSRSDHANGSEPSSANSLYENIRVYKAFLAISFSSLLLVF